MQAFDDPDQPVFSISTAAQLLHISPQTLRLYETEGLILPARSSGNQRKYSRNDLERLRCLREALQGQKLTISGIKRILALLPCWTIVRCSVAFVIGIGFGFFLERAGFGGARKLVAQFYLNDLTVFKVMFTAIITAMVGLYYLSVLGIVDLSLVYVGTTYLMPQIVGGLVLGVGFVVGGYCPGTSCVAVATGRIDGLVTLFGIVVGISIFAETFFFHRRVLLLDRPWRPYTPSTAGSALWVGRFSCCAHGIRRIRRCELG